MEENQSNGKSCCSCSMSLCGAMKAGILAGITMTLVMALLGTNATKGLGMMLVGSEASTTMMYVAGCALHLLISAFYGLVYAIIFAPLGCCNKLVKALIFGTLLTVIAFYTMPHMGGMINKVRTDYLGLKPVAMASNPCNPCMNKVMEEHMKDPTNPCMQKAMSDHMEKYSNPCANNPCAKEETGLKKWVTKAHMKSWVNHFVFALVLALLYQLKRKA